MAKAVKQETGRLLECVASQFIPNLVLKPSQPPAFSYLHIRTCKQRPSWDKDWFIPSLVPRPCPFVACSTKFILQVTNVQSLGKTGSYLDLSLLFYCLTAE